MSKDPFAQDPFEEEGVGAAATSPAATPESTGPPPKRGLRPIAAIKVWLILVLAGAVGLGYVVGGKLKGKLGKPTYGSKAIVSVDPVASYMLFTNAEWHQKSSPAYFPKFKKAVTALFEAPPVHALAGKIMDEKFPSWRPEGPESLAAIGIKKAIKLTPGKDSALLTIDSLHANPEIAAAIPNALAQGMIEYLQNMHRTTGARLIKELESEATALDQRMLDKRAELDAVLATAGDLVIQSERQNIYYERIKAMEEYRSKLTRERALAEGAFEKAVSMAERLTGPPDPTEVEAALDQDTSVKAGRVREQYLREEAIKRMGGLGDQHPQYQASKKSIEEAARELKAMLVERRTALLARMVAARKHEGDLLVFDAEHTLKSSQQAEKTIGVAITGARADLRRYGELEKDTARVSDELTDLTDQRVRIGGRLNQIRIELRAPSRVTIASPATVPGEPVKSKKAMLLYALYVVGAIMGAVMGIVIETIRKLVRGVSDVKWIPGVETVDLQSDKGLIDPWAPLISRETTRAVWIDWPRAASRIDRLIEGVEHTGRPTELVHPGGPHAESEGPEILRLVQAETHEAASAVRRGTRVLIQVPVKRCKWPDVAQVCAALTELGADVTLVVVKKGKRRPKLKSAKVETSDPAATQAA